MRGRRWHGPRCGRGAAFFFGVHNVAVDSKGNVYTTEMFEGKRLQKFKVASVAPGEVAAAKMVKACDLGPRHSAALVALFKVLPSQCD